MTGNNPNIDFVNINAYTKFDEILSICSKILNGNKILMSMKKVNKQCLLDTPRTVRVSEKTWQVIVRTRRP